MFPTEASLVAKELTGNSNIPVVFGIASIEGVNLVNSVLEPGENITGVRHSGPELALERFEIMRKLMPKAREMWVPYQKGDPSVASQLEVLRPAAVKAGVAIKEVPASDAVEVRAGLEALLADKILRGTPAGTIPVISSQSFLQINYRAAQKAGITVPEGLLERADQIIH